jgi:NhaP-type Na+/H+ and K+/H+ antiporter
VRGEDVIMAHHDTVVQADDHVILFITDRRHVEQVERLFLGEIALSAGARRRRSLTGSHSAAHGARP